MRSWKKIAAVAAALTVAGLTLSACSSVGARSDMIGVVVGDGSNSDARVSDIVYPGETANVGANEDVYYFPANSRNYVIDNRDSGAVDRKTPATGYTSDGVPVDVSVTAFWTINQDKDVLTDKFWPFCFKYLCASSDPNERTDRSATEGWVSMLDNDMSPAIDETVRLVIPEFTDAIWQEQAGWDEIAARLSDEFNAQMRVRTGFTDDIFCGSGDVSGWKGGEPGTDGATFTCGPVRFVVTNVEAADAKLQDGADAEGSIKSQVDQNAALLEAAKAKYGENGGEYLALLDLIKQCQAGGNSCTVVLGGNGVSVVPTAPAPAE